MANRFERRMAILRGKRQGSFDRNQHYLERASRTKVARKARHHLRAMRPVVLKTPRFSLPERFLDDLAVDLRLGQPTIFCRTLSLAPLEGCTAQQARSWLMNAFANFCLLNTEPSSVLRVSSSHDFRVLMKELFRRAEATDRRCLLVHGIDTLPTEALRDLVAVFEDHVHHRRGAPGFNLLLAGLELPEWAAHPAVVSLTLPDFSDEEAVEALVEQLGPENHLQYSALVATVGGIPEVIEALGSDRSTHINRIVRDPSAFWAVLGPLAESLRKAHHDAIQRPALADRLRSLATRGPLAPYPELDDALAQVGLVETSGQTPTMLTTALRAPVLADLILSPEISS
ncbi:MAG: hypothetical protein AAGA48_39535 [Myxococcota bacterium]